MNAYLEKLDGIAKIRARKRIGTENELRYPLLVFPRELTFASEAERKNAIDRDARKRVRGEAGDLHLPKDIGSQLTGNERRQYYYRTTRIASDVRKEVASPSKETGVLVLTANAPRISTPQAYSSDWHY